MIVVIISLDRPIKVTLKRILSVMQTEFINPVLNLYNLLPFLFSKSSIDSIYLFGNTS